MMKHLTKSMGFKRVFVFFLFLFSFLLGLSNVQAEKRKFVVCLPLGEGSSAQATRHMEPFLRHLEKKAGWESGSVEGKYINSLSECLSYIEKTKPDFGVLSQGIYLQMYRKWRLGVIGRVDMPRGAGRRLYLVVEKGKYSSLSDLKGTVLKSNHVADSAFLNKVVFKGKIDATKHFKLSPTSSPLRGFKSVYRGRAGATLVNDDELKLMRKRKEGKKLKVLMSSMRFPGTPVVAFKKNAKSKDIRTLTKTLSGLCSGEGNSVCRNTMIRSFKPASNATYSKLRKLYR